MKPREPEKGRTQKKKTNDWEANEQVTEEAPGGSEASALGGGNSGNKKYIVSLKG